MLIWTGFIAFIVLVFALPSLAGALFRLVAPAASPYRICLGIGLLFTILSEGLDKTPTLVRVIDVIREADPSTQTLGVLIIIMVAVDIRRLFGIVFIPWISSAIRGKAPQTNVSMAWTSLQPKHCGMIPTGCNCLPARKARRGL